MHGAISRAPLEVKVMGGLACALALLTLLGFTVYRNTKRLVNDHASVIQTQEIIAHLQDLAGIMSDIETGQRGFVITQEADFLEPYTNGVQRVSENLATLRTLVSGSPIQLRNTASLETFIARKMEISGIYTDLDGQHGRVPVGPSEIGLIASERRPHVTHEVAADPRIADKEWARREGLVSFAGYPLIVEKRLAGVTALFARQKLSESALRAMEVVAGQIAIGIERRRIESQQAALLEELESANKELSDFAYIVSHDLKAPLRAIGSLVNWLASDYSEKLGEDGRAQLHLLIGRVKRMSNLIDGILVYSRASRAREQKVLVNLEEVVRNVIDLLSPPPHIRVDIGSSLPMLFCEPTRIAQVFQNLLSNAIKYMDKPAGWIRITCVQQDQMWRFGVADNGPGIEEKYFAKIFQLFQTLAARDDLEATGVGLSVVKRIVELNGGEIWLESVLGRGTTFYFTLPRMTAYSAHAYP